MNVNHDECEAAGLDPQKVETARRKVQAAINYARNNGIDIFMGSSCTIRAKCEGRERPLILANLHNCENCDGGAGDAMEDENGLERGE